MSRRQLRADDEEGFLRAYKDELLDVAHDHGCNISCSLVVPLMGTGVVIRLRAYRNGTGHPEECLATFDQPYPSHTATRLHAALYRAMVRLGIELRDKRRLAAQGDVQPTEP